jgi:cold shock CspA family protein
MKLIVHQNQINGHPEHFLRNAGYGFIVDRRLGKESFVRRLGRDHYPRLHMYVKREGEKVVFDIHLDQKQASYAGAKHMHNADHDGPVVAEEINRLKEIIIGSLGMEQKSQQRITNGGDMNAVGNGSFDNATDYEEKKGWLGRLFS